MATTQPAYKKRSGENSTCEFTRSGRFYCQQGNWYFKTREGLNYGPYSSRTECKYAYDEFIDVVSGPNDLGGIPVDFDSGESDFKIPKINFS